jgi:hypothetical protein
MGGEGYSSSPNPNLGERIFLSIPPSLKKTQLQIERLTIFEPAKFHFTVNQNNRTVGILTGTCDDGGGH